MKNSFGKNNYRRSTIRINYLLLLSGKKLKEAGVIDGLL